MSDSEFKEKAWELIRDWQLVYAIFGEQASTLQALYIRIEKALADAFAAGQQQTAEPWPSEEEIERAADEWGNQDADPCFGVETNADLGGNVGFEEGARWLTQRRDEKIAQLEREIGELERGSEYALEAFRKQVDEVRELSLQAGREQGIRAAAECVGQSISQEHAESMILALLEPKEAKRETPDG